MNFTGSRQDTVYSRPCSPDGKENPLAVKKPEDHGNHVIVASEPSTYNSKEWNLIEKNHCLMVDKGGKARLEKLELPQEWNATMN